MLLVVDPTETAETRWIDAVLRMSVERGASDLHIHVGRPPMIRLDGELTTLGMPQVSAEQSEESLIEMLNHAQVQRLHDNQSVEFAYRIEGLARFRVSLYKQRHGTDGVFRIIPLDVPTLEDLGIPKEAERFTEYHNGLVLFTGPKSCGKSTTLAAMVSMLNHSANYHILTVEDPVEFVHVSDQSNVNHREVGSHTKSFDRALQAALREDPDVIVVGELRDRASMSLAITAAETGHLVLGTLHTTGAVRTLYRLLDAFGPEEQAQVAVQLSESLRGVVSQRLVPAVPSLEGPKRVPAVEILDVNPAVSNLIRERKLLQVHSIMQTSRSMCTLDDSLELLMKQQRISRTDALRASLDKKRFIAQARGGR